MDTHSHLRKYLRLYPQWHFRPPKIQTARKLQKLGSDYGGYFVDPLLVSSDAIVYSLGVGEDISFDLSVIEKFGATVHAFDPTPKAKTWLESQSLPEQFSFQAIGAARFDGEVDFYLPPRSDFVSHSIIRAQQYSRDSIRVPVMKLSTAMRRLQHSRLDILKMDIEGAEYEVLDDLIKDDIYVKQIVVEFHHRLSSIGIAKTRAAISALNNYGMKISYICPRMEVFTFIRLD
ncbi:MAG TPA: FkbM family methyltransferase [Terriglobales bacterium]|jgi:FkbM family methyltransferase